MLLERELVYEAYDLIKEDAVGGGCTVLILVSPEVDAIAACRLLTYLLRVDNIQYKIKLVRHVEDVTSTRTQLDSGEIHTVVMLNCGATMNVRNTLELSHDDKVRVLVLDSHRPVHLSNIHADQAQVVVFDDGMLANVDIPSDGDDSDNDSDSDDGSDTESEARSEEDLLSEDEEDVDAGSETEFDLEDGDKEAAGEEEEEKGVDDDDEALNDSEEEDNGNEDTAGEGQETSGEGAASSSSSRRMKKRKASTANLPGRDGDGNLLSTGDGSDDEPGGEDDGDGENHAAVSTAAARRAARRDRRARVASYYEGCHFGLPSALVLFDLCSKLNRADNDQIWLACLGITDSFVNEKMTEETYNFFHAYMKSHIARTNGASANSSAQARQVDSSDGTVKVAVSEDGRLSADSELQFAHFRHWSLYDAMYFSPFVSTRLRVWQTPGKAKLHELFAKLGLSLDQCKQKWAFVSPQSKARVLERIEDYAEEFGLHAGLHYSAFQRTVSFSRKTTAMDVVLAAHALLEEHAGAPLVLEKSSAAATTCGVGASAGGGAEADNVVEASNGEGSEDWSESFWKAYDVLLGKDEPLLARGVDMSIRVQRAVVERAVSLVEKRSLTALKHFRYVTLPMSSSGSDGLFTQPIALTRLALYLVEMHRANKKWMGHKARPLVLFAEKDKSCLVLGVTCPELKGYAANNFGKAFSSAAAHCGASVKSTSFESSLLEIDREDVKRFTESLHFTMDL